MQVKTLSVLSKQLTNNELLLALSQKHPNHSHNNLLLINIRHQRLYQIKNQTLLKEYLISSAANGVGNKENSGQTPLGAHTICEKIGDNVPLGTQFKARQSTGFTPPILTSPNQSSDGDYITSRILRLCGLETGYNQGDGVDSYHRYIYIHGTDEEGRLGMPVSHGCIRMANQDIIDLYTEVETETLVYILEQ